ncbi:MAG: sensor domain-containing diguanylate cyclase [Oscillospiraceae bacterium]
MFNDNIRQYIDSSIIEFIFDRGFYTITWASSHACRLFGIDEDKIIKHNFSSFFDQDEFDGFATELSLHNGDGYCDSAVHLKNEKTALLHGRAFKTDDKRTHAVVTITDILQSKNALDEISRLRELAYTDSMTHLLNKVTFRRRVNEFLGVIGKSGKHCIMLVDIDNFKQINDTYGHPFGDTIILEASRAISTVFRQSDLIGRIGGDEFMVFMKDATQESAVKKAAELCGLMSAYAGENKGFTLSSSIGIAFCGEGTATFDELYKAADMALYESKRNGKSRATVYVGNSLEQSQSAHMA